MKKIALIVFVFSSTFIHTVSIKPITTKAEFIQVVSTKKPVVLIVSGGGCAPCVALKAWLAKAPFHGVAFISVDFRVARSFELAPIKAVPTIFGFKDGEISFMDRGYSRAKQNSIKALIAALIK